MEEKILYLVLQNAIKFSGKPNPKAVLGKVLSTYPETKKDIEKTKKIIEETISYVETLTQKKQEEILKKKAPKLLEKKPKEKPKLKELEKATKGKVITRIPPEPSKHLHIGHALSFIINYSYAKKYEGKTILRLEDTNPELSKQEYVDSIQEDLEFLNIKYTKTKYASDDIEKMLKECEKLIQDKKAYVCKCEREQASELKKKGTQCNCINDKEQIKQYKEMVEGKVKEGSKTIRLKGDMKSKNYSLRDPIIFRITKKEHYRQGTKYSLWPLYDFANAYEDGTGKITHIMRSIEFGTMKAEVQNLLKKYLKLPEAKIIQYGRFNIEDATTKGREIRELIEKGKIKNWDDPRLSTIKTLKRRGIQKETLYEIATQVGLSKTQTKITWDLISSINRKLIDKKTKRLFFIENPTKITIENSPEKILKLKTHPEQKTSERILKVKEEFYINKKQKIEQKSIYRLLDHINFEKEKKYKYHSEDIETYRKKGKETLIWLPVNKENIETEIIMDDGKTIKGLTEPTIQKFKVGDIVQFMKFGFCKIEKKNKDKVQLIYCHK